MLIQKILKAALVAAFLSAPLAQGQFTMASYVDRSGIQHIVIEGFNNELYQSFFQPGTGWISQNITSQSGSPLLLVGSPLSVYVLPNGEQHFVFVGTGGHIYQAIYTPGPNTWASVDVTAAAGVPGVSLGAALATFYLNDQHIIFIADNHHVYQAVYTPGGPNNGWGSQDLTVVTGLPPADAKSPVTGYALNDQHVVFVGANRHIYQAVFTPGSGWGGQDVTLDGGLPVVGPGSHLTSYKLNDQHIVFVGEDQHVYQAVFTPGRGWGGQDVTNDGHLPPARPDTSLASYALNDQHIVYVGYDYHIYQSVFTPGPGRNDWGGQDVTTDAHGAPVAHGSPLAAFALGDQHITYLDAMGTTFQAVFTPGSGWGIQNVTVDSSPALPPASVPAS